MVRNVLFATLVFAMLGSSCERPIELQLPQPEPRLVVISNFTHDQKIRVEVSQTRNVLSSSIPEYVLNAKVQLFQEEQLLEELMLVHSDDGQGPYYTTTHYTAQIGVNYLIRVTAPGFPSVSAENRIPPQTAIEQLSVENFRLPGPGLAGDPQLNYTISFTFNDDDGEQNYYHLVFFQEIQSFILDRTGDTLFAAPELRRIQFDPNQNTNNQIAHIEGGLLLNDTPFNGKQVSLSLPVQMPFNPSKEIAGDLIAELRSVSRDYFLFYSALSKQQESPNALFAEPVSPYNNIMNGVGIFAGYSQTATSIRLSR